VNKVRVEDVSARQTYDILCQEWLIASDNVSTLDRVFRVTPPERLETFEYKVVGSIVRLIFLKNVPCVHLFVRLFSRI